MNIAENRGTKINQIIDMALDNMLNGLAMGDPNMVRTAVKFLKDNDIDILKDNSDVKGKIDEMIDSVEDELLMELTNQ